MTNSTKKKHAPVLFVIGLAGAGRSVVLKTLEDLGYEAVDNMPLFLVSSVLKDDQWAQRPFAFSFDLRSRYFSVPAVLELLADVKAHHIDCQFVFLDSDDNVIERRYRETRRHHPLSDGQPLAQAIAKERKLLAPLKEAADHVLDTSLLDPIELKAMVRKLFGFEAQKPVIFEVLSFSFVGGIPRQSNLVFDMRFLKNPHYDPDLQSLTGCDREVQEFLETLPLFRSFRDQVTGMLGSMLPSVEAEGRGMFVVSFGCSGGRHRSVAMAEAVQKWMLDQGVRAQIHHRELDF